MRDPRFVWPHRLVEVTDVVIQNRYLLRPSEELNDLFLGVVGRAQRIYEMRIVALTVLSTHAHWLLVPRDAEQLAAFFCHVKANLSKEIGDLHQWPGRLWQGRYKHILVSDEEAAQVARLKYCLANGVKEFLVDHPAQWPGVHSVEALTEGKPLVGHWYARTKEFAARQLRREDFEPMKYATEERVVLEPLPCWADQPADEVRRRVQSLVAEIEEEGAMERKRTGKQSLGARKILRARSHKRPKNVEPSPKPRFHAIAAAAFEEMREAYREVLRAYREATEMMLAGVRDVVFPEGTFPPGLPFEPFPETLLVRARGQPS